MITETSLLTDEVNNLKQMVSKATAFGGAGAQHQH